MARGNTNEATIAIRPLGGLFRNTGFAGGKRLLQKAEGYDATIVSGVVTFRDGAATGALPGRMVKGQRPAIAEAAE